MSCRIETSRLVLVPFDELNHVERTVSWLNDPEVVKYSEQRHVWHTERSVSDWHGDFVGYRWAVLERAGGHIGNVTGALDKPNDVVDLAILMGVRGYGKEAWVAVLDWLLERHRMVTAGCMKSNEAMFRILSDTMEYEGCRRGRFLLNGARQDMVYFARSR